MVSVCGTNNTDTGRGGFHCEQEVVRGRRIEIETIACFDKVKIRILAVKSMVLLVGS